MSLPASFSSNTETRMCRYLNQSNLIESFLDIDYNKKVHQKMNKGHFGALIHSQQLAIDHKPLHHRDVRQWQAMLTEEQRPYGHVIEKEEIGHIRSESLPKNVSVGGHRGAHYQLVPLLLQELIEEVNKGLKDQEKLTDDVEYCNFLSRSFQTFESIHPFTDGNGRTGRLLANYIATFCNRPIIVFESGSPERSDYYSAHKSTDAMAEFMAKKVKEAIFSVKGNLLVAKAKDLGGSTVRYRSDQGEEETCEWHKLRRLADGKAQGKDGKAKSSRK